MIKVKHYPNEYCFLLFLCCRGKKIIFGAFGFGCNISQEKEDTVACILLSNII